MFFRFFFLLIVSMVGLSHCQDGEKPGTCPAVKPGSVGICIVECTNDYECKGNQKCCNNPCGRGTCAQPIEDIPPAQKPGTCPAVEPGSVGICIVQCTYDYECKGNLKCCKNPCGGGICTKPIEDKPPAPKPGTCPAVEPGSVGICIVECTYDYECKGNLKCCKNPCGGGICTKPIEDKPPAPKPGTCPAVEPGSVGICIVECTYDYECKGNLKCCKNPCGGGICTNPVEDKPPAQKPGTCPAVKPGSVGICIVECTYDYECKGNLKCCKNPCGGGICTKPVEDKPPAPKPGVCPAIKPGTGGVCANTCDNDSSCPGNRKCCTNACGGTSCVKPVAQLVPYSP